MSNRRRSFKELLDGSLSEDEIETIHSSFDVIGDIAIIKIPKDLLNRKEEISKALHLFLPKIRVIAMVSGETDDLFRVRGLEVLYGDGDTETVHREWGCSFKLDVKNVFFSPRLSYERHRIAEMVQPEETIINMFSGVGTYSIIIAKRCPGVKIYSIEINPHAYSYMAENIKLNNLEGSVIPIFGNAKEKILRDNAIDSADRVIMPLPDYAYKFLDVAISSLKSGGALHYYDVAYELPDDESLSRLYSEADRQGRRAEIKSQRILRSVGPRKYHIVIDAEVF
ncbi:MAG: class I SAM-dependent methyltransferase family protein [Halobacteriota archaeon]|nr:class I SAM-dependent methyltransferase family protein [Halobacteriota archaeon]